MVYFSFCLFLFWKILIIFFFLGWSNLLCHFMCIFIFGSGKWSTTINKNLILLFQKHIGDNAVDWNFYSIKTFVLFLFCIILTILLSSLSRHFLFCSSQHFIINITVQENDHVLIYSCICLCACNCFSFLPPHNRHD